MPSLLILGGVVVLGVVGSDGGFSWVLLAAAVIAAVLAALWSASAPAVARAWPSNSLWSVSLQTWLQGALAALLVASVLSLVRWLGATLNEVGVLSLGLYVYQLFAVFATYAAPMVYDRVAGDGLRVVDPAVGGHWSRCALTVAIPAVLGALIAPRLVALAWPAVAAHVGSMTCFALAGLAALGTRLGSTLLQAGGRFRELSFQAAWRLALVLVLVAISTPLFSASLGVPFALLGVELLTGARLAMLLRGGAA